jgi:hypothetical protein
VFDVQAPIFQDSLLQRPVDCQGSDGLRVGQGSGLFGRQWCIEGYNPAVGQTVMG